MLVEKNIEYLEILEIDINNGSSCDLILSLIQVNPPKL